MTNFEKLLDEQLSTLCFKPNEIVEAAVVEVDRHKVLVDVGLHTTGELKITEFMVPPSVGDYIQVVVDELDDGEGNLKISHNEVMVKQQLDDVQSLVENKTTVDAKVVEIRKAGLIVNVGYLTGFMPKRQASIEYVEDFTSFLNQVFKVKILSHDQIHENLIVSHKQYLIDEIGGEIARLEAPVEVGGVYEGKVTGIAPFGLFVDIGSHSTVLLHITDINWDLTKAVIEDFKFGDILSLRAKSVVTSDNGSQRICMSLKHMDMSPWEKAKDDFVIGERFKATIYKIEEETGNLIVSINGIPGVVENKDVSWTRMTNSNLNNVFKRGQEIDVVVKGFENKMGFESIVLSHKGCQSNPWESINEKFKVGQVLDTVVTSVSEKMLFVKVEGDVEAIVHVREVDWINPFEAIKSISSGDNVRVKLMEIDSSERKVSASICRTTEDPYKGIVAGTKVLAKVESIRVNSVHLSVLRKGKKLEATLPARYVNTVSRWLPSGEIEVGCELNLEVSMIMSGILYLKPDNSERAQSSFGTGDNPFAEAIKAALKF
ncbi:S1 RNA-binding domain-containing protein [Photobacterium kishitanii]|uniref:S1 motif domain-containing protein n=1 Tax=Photobacterium kishitanii TaxID=318456 RepID=A0A2T3KMQ5_9GAMM|nr:S1 RNA-binding domain-containing protein [Photobacterium kishitanii]PSV01062.1 hypothetical protein C9J27_03325 [Photobacterium kishitanii]